MCQNILTNSKINIIL